MDTNLDQQPVEDIGAAPAADGSALPRRRWPWLAVLLLVAAAVAAVLSIGFGRDPTVVQTVFLDRAAPALAGPTLDGPPFDIADHRGKVVVVNVWASWCTACKKEHPELEAAAQRLSGPDVQFVGINTQDTLPDARAFMEEMGESSYPSVRDPDGRKAVDWGIFGVPETFIIDPQGTVRAKAVGAVNEEWVVQTAAMFLPGSKGP